MRISPAAIFRQRRSTLLQRTGIWKPPVELGPVPVTQRVQIRETVFPSAQIRGFVDGITGDEIRGWVVDDAEPERYIKLCLVINGQFVEKTTSCIFRKDLEQLFCTRGLHGFCFRIPHALRSEAEISVEIRLEDGRLLWQIPRLRNPSPAPEDQPRIARKPLLLMLHIPKTAVTAVRSALRSDWLTDRQLWLYPEAPGLPEEHVLYLSEAQLQRVECVWGHFCFGTHVNFPQPFYYATIFREPVQRAVSHYFHERAKSPDLNSPARNLDLGELLRTCPSVMYDNLAVRMLTNNLGLPLGCVTRDVYRLAIENIQQSFCYLGLQGRTKDAVTSIASYLNLQPNPLQMENLGTYDRRSSASAFATSKLQELNEFDLELYEYVEKTFWASGNLGWNRNHYSQ